MKIDNVKKYLRQYCIRELLILLFLSFFMFLVFSARNDFFLVDVGREAYVPWQMYNGEVLYKDIFNVYGPLAYQINTLLYMILGVKLSTLYFAGYINAFFIISMTFFITKLFTPKRLALLVSVLIIFSCVYIKTFFNFIFPYSYAAVYSLSGYLCSVFCFLFFLRDRNKKYLYFSFLAAGFAFANKIEYFTYFILLFLSLVFIKPKMKEFFYCIGAFCAIPVISFSILIFQGAKFYDFYNALLLAFSLLKTNAAQYFYTHSCLYTSKNCIYSAFQMFINVMSFLIPCFVVLWGMNFLNQNKIKNKIVNKIFNVLIYIFCFVIAVIFYKHFEPLNYQFFSWLGCVCILIFSGLNLLFIYKWYMGKQISKKSWIFLFCITSALLASVKGISKISTESYGTFLITVLVVPFFAFIYNYVFKLLKDRKSAYKAICNLCIILIFLFFMRDIKEYISHDIYQFNTKRGKINVSEYIKGAGGVVGYIENNAGIDDTVVVLPEGAMINFLSGRKSNNKYYYLIPVNVELFGEKKIIEDFVSNPPEYFVIDNMEFNQFNSGSMWTYMADLFRFIESNYDLKIYTNDKVSFYVYKLRNKKSKLQ